MDNIIALIRVD